MPEGESATATAERLAATIDGELSRLLEPGAEVALLNFPKLGNLGDSAMWLGELAALHRAGARIRYQSDSRAYRRQLLRSAVGERGTILLHGGGNIGDVYPLQQRVRERVLRDFPEARVIQLPQTIWFRDERNAESFGELCRTHRDFTLMVREGESVGRAREGLGLDAVLSPDMAFGLGPLRRPSAPTVDVLWLIRDDRERTSGEPAVGPGSERREWPDKFGGDAVADSRGLRRALWLNGLFSAPLERGRGPSAALWRAAAQTHKLIARRRVELALATLTRARVVVTDRLHGHVLSTLLGIPHVVLDSASGKSRGVYQTWTAGCETIRFAEGVDAAGELAHQLLAGATRASATAA